MSFTSSKYTSISSNGPAEVEARSGVADCKLWFKTPALDEDFLRTVSHIRLQTTGRDQGWVSQPEKGSWSWFDIAILESGESTTPLVKDDLIYVWRSHCNKIGHGRDETINGDIFYYKEHDLFKLLKPGYALAVFVCARFSGWRNHASSGRLLFCVEEELHELPTFNAEQSQDKRKMQELKKNIDCLVTGYLKDKTEKPSEGNRKSPQDDPAYLLFGDSMRPNEALRMDLARERHGGPLRLLSIDGGGIRGVSSLIILSDIMHKLTGDPDSKPCDYFDMICGTSTGGLIALMLGRLGMTIPQCITTYNKLASQIFRYNSTRCTFLRRGTTGFAYRASTFESAIKAIVKQYSGDSGNTMIPKSTEPYCKVFVVAGSANDLGKSPEHLRTYKPMHPNITDNFINIPIWQAARATSAAPTYLPSINIKGTELVDGGLMYNNPIALLLGEAYHEFGVERLLNTRCILTIGTGHPPTLDISTRRGIFHHGKFKYYKKVFKTLAEIATDCENTHSRARKVFKEEDIYWRFNVETKGGAKVAPLDHWQGMNSLVNDAHEYIKSPVESARVQKCASKLNIRSEGRRKIEKAD
ncbi:hypothetical protein AB1N83_004040 [Pleurotus pulmonarius]